jgi:hypothetical protein
VENEKSVIVEKVTSSKRREEIHMPNQTGHKEIKE